MTTLLIVNALMLGIPGLMFTVWGSNPQSRVMGFIMLAWGMVNLGVVTGNIAL